MECRNPLRGLSPLVTLLCICFGLGTWVSLNGIWVELPQLARVLPESWSLPGYLTILFLVANIGPLCLMLAVRFRKGRHIPERPLVAGVLALSAFACLLLVFFWDGTGYIAGDMYSVALLTLFFISSLTDCMTSVVFLPYMGRFPPGYMAPYFLGEGLSGLLPTLLALAQGAGRTECKNSTVYDPFAANGSPLNTIMSPFPLPPSFSVSIFFVLPFLLLVLSGVSFLLLEILPPAKREHVYAQNTDPGVNMESTSQSDSKNSDSKSNSSEVSSGSRSEEKDRAEKTEPHTRSHDLLISEQTETGVYTKSQVVMLLVGTGWAACLLIGVMPSVQVYTALPYSQSTYHLAVTLSSITNPVACLIAMFLPSNKPRTALIHVGLGSIFAAYLLYLAGTSPEPPLVGCLSGEVIVVVVWVLFTATLTYSRAVTAAILQRVGAASLRYCGAATQLGAFVGAFCTWTIVGLLVQSNPCDELPPCYS